MSQATAAHIVLVGTTVVPGSGLTAGNCLPCQGVSGRAVTTLSTWSSRFHCRFHSQVNIGPLRCAPVGAAYVCKASSNNGHNRRNLDFSRQNRQGFSRGRNRQQNDERDGDRDSFENLEESDILSSKNGPSLSLSNSPKFQATAAPGPREKEIVELFRKVQAQLRERAASKEDKRTESVQGQGKENETVDSLLKLLRRHSAEQSKRSSSGSGNNSREFVYDQQRPNGQYNRGKSTGSSNSNVKDHARDSILSFARPVSNFQRKSPVPRLKFQPVYSDDDTVNSVPRVNSSEAGREKHEDDSIADVGLEFEPPGATEHHEESESELEAEPELVQLLEGNLLGAEEALIVNNDNDDENGEEQLIEHEDLAAWKLPELRALAKSRGVKGYSKMKKGELVDLLSGSRQFEP